MLSFSAIVVLLIFILFPLIIFKLYYSAVSDPNTLWYGIAILAAILIGYSTCMTFIFSFLDIVRSDMPQYRPDVEWTLYLDHMQDALNRTETPADAFAAMDAEVDAGLFLPASNSLAQIAKFRWVWIFGGVLLFASSFVLTCRPHYREKHASDCIVLFLAALVVFLTGIFQFGWRFKLDQRERSFHAGLKKWHSLIPAEIVLPANAELSDLIAAARVKLFQGQPVTSSAPFLLTDELILQLQPTSGAKEDAGPNTQPNQ